MAKLEADGEFAEQYFVHGLGVQTAEGLAEWLHYEVRNMLAIPATQGRRYSWGYPAVPEQSEHLKVEKLLHLAQIGMTITDGYALSRSSRRSRSSPITRRRSTSAPVRAGCCPTAHPTT